MNIYFYCISALVAFVIFILAGDVENQGGFSILSFMIVGSLCVFGVVDLGSWFFDPTTNSKAVSSYVKTYPYGIYFGMWFLVIGRVYLHQPEIREGTIVLMQKPLEVLSKLV